MQQLANKWKQNNKWTYAVRNMNAAPARLITKNPKLNTSGKLVRSCLRILRRGNIKRPVFHSKSYFKQIKPVWNTSVAVEWSVSPVANCHCQMFVCYVLCRLPQFLWRVIYWVCHCVSLEELCVISPWSSWKWNLVVLQWAAHDLWLEAFKNQKTSSTLW